MQEPLPLLQLAIRWSTQETEQRDPSANLGRPDCVDFIAHRTADVSRRTTADRTT